MKERHMVFVLSQTGFGYVQHRAEQFAPHNGSGLTVELGLRVRAVQQLTSLHHVNQLDTMFFP
jgi:hypothetical protein